MTLDQLALKYDTDKGSSSHWYTRYYSEIFGPIREQIESFLEIGIGSGASLRMWRDYFPNAFIYGIDNNPFGEIEPRVKTFNLDQTDCDTITSNFKDKKLEIIVEDASHHQDKTLITLNCLFPFLQPRGWYVIEDMDRSSFAPQIGQWFGGQLDADRLHIFPDRSKGSDIIFIRKV